jgi:hypothetical protein
MAVVGDFALLNEGIDTSQTRTGAAFHAPESVGGARKDSHRGRNGRDRLHDRGDLNPKGFKWCLGRYGCAADVD